MEDSILSLPKQFTFEPEITNQEILTKAERIIVAGMGGSHLAAGIVKAAWPEIDITVHNDYGLPALPLSVLKQSLIIVSSYSGNTVEAISCFEAALEQGLPVAAISSGGRLKELAEASKTPFCQIPAGGIQPRMALGYSLCGLLTLMGRNDLVQETGSLTKLNSEETRPRGEVLATNLQQKIPLVYGSKRNSALTYIWKIKFNETAKIPAFANVLPELNHNEMEGFDTSQANLLMPLAAVLLEDVDDHQEIQKRWAILKELLPEKGIAIHSVSLPGNNRLERIFHTILMADWTTLALANSYGHNPEAVPLIEQFKKKLSQ